MITVSNVGYSRLICLVSNELSKMKISKFPSISVEDFWFQYCTETKTAILISPNGGKHDIQP